MTRRSLFAASLLFATFASAQAVPTKLNFTARLVDAGAPVQGNRDFVFKLYPTVMMGTAIWTETRNAVAVVDGAVNVDLGASTPLTDAIFDGQTLYLEVAIGTQVLTPRTAVVSVPYALRSAVAGQVGSLTAAQIQQRVANGCGVGSAIQTINADGTVVCQAAGAANDAGVTTITSITAGAGLTGGGATGNVTLAVAYGGSGGGNGTSSSAARFDHLHQGVYLPLGPTLACSGTDKVVGLNSSGSVLCGVDINTSYTAGATGGLAVNASNQFSLISCPPTQVLVAGAAGSWACAAAPGVTSVGATPPLTSSGGTAPSVALAACPTAGQFYKMAGGVWTCGAETAPVGNTPIAVGAGNTISLTLCPNAGDVYKIISGAWRCGPDANSGGTVTSVGATAPLTSTGGAAPVISLGVVPVANGGAGVSLAATGGAGQFVKQSAAGGTLSVGAITVGELPVHLHAAGDITSGTVGVAFGGTGASLTASGGPGQVVKQSVAAGPLSVGPLNAGDLPAGTQIWGAQPNCPAGQYLSAIGSSGTPTCVAVPAFGAIYSGSCAAAVGATCNIAVPGSYAVGSTAGTATLNHIATGVYAVGFPWLNTGVPQVTAYGAGTAFCKVSSWGSFPIVVNVGCYTIAGVATDSLFNITVNSN